MGTYFTADGTGELVATTEQDTDQTWEVSFTGDYMTLTTTITNANNHEQAIIIAKELILDYYGIDTFALGLTDILTETL